jgi:hypothetical protein
MPSDAVVGNSLRAIGSSGVDRTERFLLLFRIEHLALGVAHKFRGKFLLQFLGSSSNKKLPQYAPEGVSKSYWLLGVVVADGVAAGAGVWLKVSIRMFQSSPSRIIVKFLHSSKVIRYKTIA